MSDKKILRNGDFEPLREYVHLLNKGGKKNEQEKEEEKNVTGSMLEFFYCGVCLHARNINIVLCNALGE